MKQIIILTSVFLLIFTGCTKEKKEKEAVLTWQGSYAADGCGFFIEIKGKDYKPNNEDVIDNKFKKSSPTDVIISYELPRKDIETLCGDGKGSRVSKAIEIISIRMK